jgi:hypothetical protein
MAQNNVSVIASTLDTTIYTFRVEDRTTSSDTQILAGEPVKLGSTNNVVHVADGEPTNAAPMWGIALTDSTETATVDGTVDVLIVEPIRTVLRTKYTAGSTVNNGVLYDTVTYDVVGGVYTVDADEGTDPNVHGLQIMDFDTAEGTVDYTVRSYATESGSST